MSKETIKEFLEVVNTSVWADCPSMQEYAKSKCSDVFKSESGHLVEFEKPSIKKDFCFGHGQNGISTEEEMENAFDCASRARTDEQYFIDVNLVFFNERLKDLKENKKFYLVPSYRTQNKICSIKSEDYFIYYPFEEKNIIATLTKKDIENLIKIVESEKEKFTKRLNTYLKKYGLSKIHSWTYLVD